MTEGLRNVREGARAGREAARRPFAALFLLLLTLSGCATDDRLFDAIGAPPLRVGVSPDYPPVIFERDGTLLGIEADLARRAGEALRRPIEVVRIPFPDLIDALLAGEIDVVMSGLSITPERAARVQFTVPYMEVGQLAMIRKRDIARFGRPNTIRRAGARVGYQRATTGERYVAEALPFAESFAFDSVEDGLRSLRADRVDFFVHDAPTIWQLAGGLDHRDLIGLYRPLTKEALAWAVRREDQQLRAVLDATLSHWRREGMIEPIVQRWIPVRVIR
ncbi:MAG: transporter substrate-binding domain-containing protein [Myxococcota bacterium]